MAGAIQSAAAPRPVARKALAVVQWAFVGLLVLQIYLAGVFLMWEGDARSAHQGIGWLLTYVPFVTLVLALAARMPRPFWLSYGVMFAAIHVQPFLALVPPDDGLGWLRAVHPLNGMLVLGLAFQQARMVRISGEASSPTTLAGVRS